MNSSTTHVLSLLRSHGPVTAYAYMQEHGIETFPPSCVTTIQESIALVLEYRQMRQPSEK